ncbi:MAG: antibiotic biosynthesis monooxygenase [Rhodobacteraceae bacterium]|nr:antibiotic biosynthesis monooxygenase [Paracoccaceae bacterium]
MPDFAPLPEPPYYAVIFASQASDDSKGYQEMAALMAELAAKQDGYIGVDSCRDADGFGITVSYWQDEAAIAAWRMDITHQVAQRQGKARWYRHYTLRVARVERGYDGPEGR